MKPLTKKVVVVQSPSLQTWAASDSVSVGVGLNPDEALHRMRLEQQRLRMMGHCAYEGVALPEFVR